MTLAHCIIQSIQFIKLGARFTRAIVHLLIALYTVLLVACSSQTITTMTNTDLFQQASEAASQAHLALRQQLDNGNLDIDYDALRKTYRESTFYAPFDTALHQAHRAASAAQEDQEFPLCIQLSEAALERDITDLFAHLNAARCYQALDNTERRKHHSTILKGLLQSIAASGDGRSIDSAYHCNSDREVRAFIELRGLLPYESTPQRVAGRQVYSVTATNPATDSELEIYFDITATLKLGAPHAP